MGPEELSLETIFDGWQGYNQSLINAIRPLSTDQLNWKPSPRHKTLGEVIRHLCLGRLVWFLRMDAPGSAPLAEKIPQWETDSDGNRDIVESALPVADKADQLVLWLEETWQMIDSTLKAWQVNNLNQTYRHVWNGEAYAVSRQWTIWRILTHDMNHGGEISLMLGMQGIEAFELCDLFGHITLPEKWEDVEEPL